MKIAATLLMLLVLFLPNTPAQEYTQWKLPEGAIARFGKGRFPEIQYSPDGTRLAVAVARSVFGSMIQRRIERLPYSPAIRIEFVSVAFSPDGKPRLPAGSGDGMVRSVRYGHRGEHKVTFAADPGWFNSVAFSPDGKLLASASSDGTVQVWKTTD